MSFCSKCNSKIPEDAAFCPNCGLSIEKAEQDPTHQIPISAGIFERMIRAAKLDPTVYEEVEGDKTATTQALTVVILSSICSGIGTAISQAFKGHGPSGIGLGLFGGLVLDFLLWLTWAFITYFIGTRIFNGTASYDELLRTLGFSNSPGVLLIFTFVPIIGGLLSFAVSIWELVAMIVAVRQALDFTTGTAILTCIVGWIVTLVLLVLFGILLALPFIFLGL